MLFDKKILGLTLLYSFMTISFVVVFLIPLRVVYQSFNMTFSLFQEPYWSYLVAKNVRILASRGGPFYLISLALFLISMFLFITFCSRGTSKHAKIGYGFSLCSVGFLLFSVILDIMIYSDRMVNYSSLIIMLAIAFTVLNVGTILFHKRNAIQTYVVPIKRKISPIIEKIKPLEVLREKEISASKETEPSGKIGNYCAYCGLKVEPDHKFCRSCGKPLD